MRDSERSSSSYHRSKHGARSSSRDRDRERDRDRDRDRERERDRTDYYSSRKHSGKARKSKHTKKSKHRRRSRSPSTSSTSSSSSHSSPSSRSSRTSKQSISRNRSPRAPSSEKKVRHPNTTPSNAAIKGIDLMDFRVQKTLETIEEDQFAPKSFYATRDREAPAKQNPSDKVIIDLNAETVTFPKPTDLSGELGYAKEQIIHPNFLGDADQKNDKWIRKLFTYRQKYMQE